MSATEFAKLLNVVIGGENEACITNVRKNKVSKLSNHNDLKYQLVTDHVQKGKVHVLFV